jgi:hypothetical protein
MGRWLLRVLGALVILGAVVRGADALNLPHVPNLGPMRMHSVRECVAQGQRGYESGIARGLGVSPGQIDARARAEMNDAMKALCQTAEARSHHPSLTKLFRSNPVAYQRLCLAGIHAGLNARPDAYWFMSRAERAGLLRKHCQLLPKYMDDDQLIDWPRLIAENPDFFVHACGAALHADLAKDPSTRRLYTPGALHRIGRRSCREGLRRGIIDTSQATSLLDFRTDDRVWTALIVQVARAEGHT